MFALALLAQTAALDLTCQGNGTADRAEVSHARVNGQRVKVQSLTPYNFTEQVDVQLFNGNDRIRMPRALLPTFSRGDKGWFRMSDVVADGHTITATVKLSFLSKSKLRIDRQTGAISIDGGAYSGVCEQRQANLPNRF